LDKNVKEPLLQLEDAKEAKGDYCTTVEHEFERVRFTVAYMTYQRMNQWWLMDTVAQHFHLLTAGFAIYLCANWQVSFIMYMQLICAVWLCVTLSRKLQANSQLIGEE
jgi:hypothetical protein